MSVFCCSSADSLCYIPNSPKTRDYVLVFLANFALAIYGRGIHWAHLGLGRAVWGVTMGVYDESVSFI